VTPTTPIADHDPAKIGPGRFVLVVGPSGAGKDTLIGFVRTACADDSGIVFPRRVVTREASVFEDNQTLNIVEFEQARTRGDFAICWHAHGLHYGLPRSIDDDIGAGRTIVANVSRTVIDAIRSIYANVTVVSVTAPPDVLVTRLAGRARNSDGQIDDRVNRRVAGTIADVTINNVSSAEEHAQELLMVVKGK
jgi:ribose 1,5-bisphosphokinase